MKKKTADEYVEIVESAIEKDPTEPVRIDFHLDQLNEIREAHRKLFHRNGEFEQWFEKMSRHPKQELSKQGFMRVAFIGPEGPKPIRVVKSPIGDCTEDSKKECEAIQSKLQKEYGDGYHVAIDITGTYTYCCEVWKGADWLRWQRATYSYKEIAESTQLLKGAEHSIHEMEPKAEIIDRKAAGERAKRQSGSLYHRPRKTWKGQTLQQLVESFVAESIDNKKLCRGSQIAAKKAAEWGETWRPDTVRKELQRAHSKRRRKT